MVNVTFDSTNFCHVTSNIVSRHQNLCVRFEFCCLSQWTRWYKRLKVDCDVTNDVTISCLTCRSGNRRFRMGAARFRCMTGAMVQARRLGKRWDLEAQSTSFAFAECTGGGGKPSNEKRLNDINFTFEN